jgi:hypothetical protein
MALRLHPLAFVRRDQSLRPRIVLTTPVALPSVNGIDRKGRGLAGGADHDHTGVAANIVDPVWSHPSSLNYLSFFRQRVQVKSIGRVDAREGMKPAFV